MEKQNLRPCAELDAEGDDAAFTLVEVAASLVVVALLTSGLADLAHFAARASVAVRHSAENARAIRNAGLVLTSFERVDPGSAVILDDVLSGSFGGEARRAYLSTNEGEMRLRMDGAASVRPAVVPAGSHFDARGDVIVLFAADQAPIVVIRPRRNVAYDCRFDLVGRRCR